MATGRLGMHAHGLLTLLVVGIGIVGAAQITNPPLDQIPSSYAPRCTTVNSDGSYSAGCVAGLAPSPGADPICGGIGAACSNTDATPLFDNACTSGYCADSQCIARQDEIGGACSATSACGATLHCDAATSTCQAYCDASQPCFSADAYCGSVTTVSGSQGICLATKGEGESLADDPAKACASGLYCLSSTQLCAKPATTVGASCSFDPVNGCAVTSNGQQLYCRGADATCQVRITTIGADCRDDPVTGCTTATAADGTTTPLYCALSTGTCQAKVTTAGQSCAYDYLGACGVTSDGVQLYPSVPVGSPGHADCTCVTQPDVVVRPSSRARARARERRNVSLCPRSHTACRVGDGFECIDTSSNIEQCGGCSGNEGSVDCTAIDDVAAVGCVSGRCEIWACEDGYEFALAQERCVRN